MQSISSVIETFLFAKYKSVFFIVYKKSTHYECYINGNQSLVSLSVLYAFLIKEFSSIDNLFQTLDERKLGNIEGFGPVLLENLYRWKEKDFYEMDIPRLLEHIQFANPVSTKSVGTESKINGISFCITGNVQHFKNRKELQQYIQEHGGIICSGVNATLDYLINNDINSQSSKNKKAKELNIPIINEQQLLKMCGE